MSDVPDDEPTVPLPSDDAPVPFGALDDAFAAPVSDEMTDGVAQDAPPEATAATVPARWYHLQGRRDRFGPLDLDTMRRLVLSGVIVPTTYVWADGMPDWRRARDVPAIAPPPTLRATLPAWGS
jgi:hypothetical protein